MIPVGTDTVGCSSIFEIRETQHAAHPINQYGNGQPARPTAPFAAEKTQPFNISNANPIGSDAQSTDKQNTLWVPASSNRYAMPTDNNEMDLSPDANVDQPSPATTISNARSQSLSGGNASGSHSSYSPGQPADQMPYRPSPRLTNQAVPMSNPSATMNNMFYSANNDMLNSALGFGDATGTMPPIGGDVDFGMNIMGNDWGGMGSLGMGDGTGMTPMSEGTWNSMLENMNMGWESAGPPHGDPLAGNFGRDK